MNDLLNQVAAICVESLPEVEKLCDQDILAYGRLLCLRMTEFQAYVTVIGETSTGKSTLMNGLLS